MGVVDFAKRNKKALIVAGALATAIATSEPSHAYIITSTGITVEPEDVTAVTDSVLVGIQVQFESLKYLGISILVGSASFLVNKVWSIKPGM